MHASIYSKSSYHRYRAAIGHRSAFVILVALGLIFASCRSVTSQPSETPVATVTRTDTPTVTATQTPVQVRVSYYVDSSIGNNENSCALAQHPETPKKTVSGVMSCDPGPGETVRFRGEFKETIFPTRSGMVLYEVQDVLSVDGSEVSFSGTITGVQTVIDYVAIYGSRSGNSGAFPVLSVSDNRVTVDTSKLPGGQFIPESQTDPGMLRAAILRPVHFTAWEPNNPPVWSGLYQAYHVINQRVIMVSYLKSIAGEAINPDFPVWPAFEIDGGDNGNSDFQIFDHLEVVNAESAIAIEAHEFQSNYDIVQFNNFHDIGTFGNSSDEIIYFGYAYRPDLHHDFVQIMYNKIGPHNLDANLGDGIDVKPSAHDPTLFGNEITGIQPAGCDDAPIKIDAENAFVTNNYIHDIDPQASLGCGISVVSNGKGAVLANNLIVNVKGIGMRVIDTDDVQILNNTIYNIFPEPDCDSACMELNMGIAVQNWQGSTERITIKNNIVQSAYIGIGRYIWSNDYPVSIESDYNLVFDAPFPFRGTIVQNTHDLITDPGLVHPEHNNYSLSLGSPAVDTGMDLSGFVRIDNHDAAEPFLPAIPSPLIRTGTWDRGAYEFK